ncbi:hypothetical protein E2C01_026397 [Portunus trituberculatus]|uniref:Uncharacterized protein n=1 Tax=Portunus trituberculatus TaxID=210409 RepID=A0A5B7EI70_PORTR|nr:hypothetical protein [Portunus trituberculatus]
MWPQRNKTRLLSDVSQQSSSRRSGCLNKPPWPLLSSPDPVGLSAPKLADSDLSRTQGRQVDSTFPLFCRAQGHPTPTFSVRTEGTSELEAPRDTLVYVLLIAPLTPEPLGLSSPKFPSADTSRSQSLHAATAISLSCPAQAHPPPQFRIWNCFALLSPFLTLTEPVGLSTPKFPNIDVSRTQVRRVGTSFPLLCEAQAHPSPAFR